MSNGLPTNSILHTMALPILFNPESLQSCLQKKVIDYWFYGSSLKEVRWYFKHSSYLDPSVSRSLLKVREAGVSTRYSPPTQWHSSTCQGYRDSCSCKQTYHPSTTKHTSLLPTASACCSCCWHLSQITRYALTHCYFHDTPFWEQPS